MNQSGVTAMKAHLALKVKSVEASVEFYKKLFGIRPSKIRTGYAKFDVENPPLNFTLNQVASAPSGALSHLGIQVSLTEDVLRVRNQWAEAGLIVRDEIKTDCCYAIQDKTWVEDPDGNQWEAFVVLQDNLPEKPAGEQCCAPVRTAEEACCTTEYGHPCCVESK